MLRSDMGRDLRVRSPMSNTQVSPAPTVTTGKRKLPGNESDLRRSARGTDISINRSEFKSNVKASWDGQYLTISGLTPGFPAESHDHPETVTQTPASSQDTATWEEKWMESPTKRRRVERASHAHHQESTNHTNDGGPSSGRPKGRHHWGDHDSVEKPKPKAVQKLARGARGNSSDANSRRTSRQNSVDRASRQTSLAASVNGRPSPSPSAQLKLEADASARSSPARSQSPPQSSPGSPTQAELGKQAQVETDRKGDPDKIEGHDLPPPFLDPVAAGVRDSYEDEADRMLRTLYPPIPPPQRFINALTAHHPSKRSTETLLTLTQNAQRALQAWQTEYIKLDKKTAPVSLPFAKKPCTGGRRPVNPEEFENEKHKDLYGDGNTALAAAMGRAQPVQTRTKTSTGTSVNGVALAGGRELRRRGADSKITDGLGISSDDAGAAKKPTRARKPVRRFDAGKNVTDADDVPANASGAPTTSKPPGARRGRWAANTADSAQPKRRRRRQGAAPVAADQQPASGPNGTLQAPSNITTTHDKLKNERPEDDDQKKDANKDSNQVEPTTGTRQNGPQSGAAANANGPDGVFNKEVSPVTASALAEKKARAKSAKRSESMTNWWAQRKKKLAEDQIKEMHLRGEFREGVWNVDTLKAWGVRGPDGMPTTAGPVGPGLDPRYAGWMAQHDPRWMAGPWPPPQAPKGTTPMAYPYPTYSWPMMSPGGHPYDPRAFQPPPPAPPPHQNQPSQNQRKPPGPKPASSRQPSLSGPHQPLTSSHPFAQPYPGYAPPHRAPSTQSTPPHSAHSKQSSKDHIRSPRQPGPPLASHPLHQQYYPRTSMNPPPPQMPSAPTPTYEQQAFPKFDADRRGSSANQPPPWQSAVPGPSSLLPKQPQSQGYPQPGGSKPPEAPPYRYQSIQPTFPSPRELDRRQQEDHHRDMERYTSDQYRQDRIPDYHRRESWHHQPSQMSPPHRLPESPRRESFHHHSLSHQSPPAEGLHRQSSPRGPPSMYAGDLRVPPLPEHLAMPSDPPPPYRHHQTPSNGAPARPPTGSAERGSKGRPFEL